MQGLLWLRLESEEPGRSGKFWNMFPVGFFLLFFSSWERGFLGSKEHAFC